MCSAPSGSYGGLGVCDDTEHTGNPMLAVGWRGCDDRPRGRRNCHHVDLHDADGDRHRAGGAGDAGDGSTGSGK